MAFDRQSARAAGYSEEEIDAYLDGAEPAKPKQRMDSEGEPDIHKMPVRGMEKMGLYAPDQAAPPNAITGQPMERKPVGTYAENRWTKAPMYIGETEELPETGSGITGRDPIGKELTPSLLNRFPRPSEQPQRQFLENGQSQRGAIYVNPSGNEDANSRLFRHESIHSLFNENGVDTDKLFSHPGVLKASQPIRKAIGAMGQDGPMGDPGGEMPAYMGAFYSKDIPGVSPAQRAAYVAAFTSALREQSPAAADKYTRMQMDASPQPIPQLSESTGPLPFSAPTPFGRRPKQDNVDQVVKPGPYRTVLNPVEELNFQEWVRNGNIPNDDSPKSDYDMRGFWKAQQDGKKPEHTDASAFDGRPHYTDQFKTPYHGTYSNQSGSAGPSAPHWQGSQLFDMRGRLVADERTASEMARDAQNQFLQDVTSYKPGKQ